MIRFENVHKRFGDHVVLDGVTIHVKKGSVHFVIGKSGAGKSVLIKQIVGLLTPDAGRILFDGDDITHLDESEYFPIRRRCQMIFQHATLFDALTLQENVAMPLRKRFGLRRRAARQRALAALARVRVDGLAARYPSELGAGIRKRVAIARAIALEPEVLLYDEPTTSLDPVAARRTDRLIREMADTLELTSVVVSHDLASVASIGDWVSFLDHGHVRFRGTPEALFAARDADICAFVHRHRAHGRTGVPL